MMASDDDDLNFDSDVEQTESSFDPAALLSEPILDDGDLMILRPSVTGQTGFAPQSHSSNFDQNQEHFAPLNDSNAQLQETQQAVTMRMQELQEQIQQVQHQIQQVQLQSSQLELQSSQVESQSSMQQNQQNFQNVQGLMNDPTLGANRYPPGRSFSNPLMQRPTMSESFVPAQQQAPTLQAMAASLQGNMSGHLNQMDNSGSSAHMMQNNSFSQGFSAGIQGSQGQAPPSNVNEAMEKLCESMRRSAMSRSLVKQLSGRAAPGSRNIGRSRSGGLARGNLGRTNSGNLNRTFSGSDTLRPIRRIPQDSKHRIQRDALSSSGGPPGRGVFRNKSSQGAMGGSTITFS